MNGLGIVPDSVRGGDYYRLVTAMFVHLGIIHLASNMATLVYVGSRLESRIGHFRFLVAYMVCGLAGNVAVLLFCNPNTVTVGASGAIFGLMGILFVWMMKSRDWNGLIIIGQSIAVNLYITFTNPSISVSGHLGGLLCGIALGLLLSFNRGNQRKTDIDERDEGRTERSHIALLIVIAVCLVIAAGTFVAVSSDRQIKIKLPGMIQTSDIESLMKLSPDRIPITK